MTPEVSFVFLNFTFNWANMSPSFLPCGSLSHLQGSDYAIGSTTYALPRSSAEILTPGQYPLIHLPGN